MEFCFRQNNRQFLNILFFNWRGNLLNFLITNNFIRLALFLKLVLNTISLFLQYFHHSFLQFFVLIHLLILLTLFNNSIIIFLKTMKLFSNNNISLMIVVCISIIVILAHCLFVVDSGSTLVNSWYGVTPLSFDST